jgi:hypothetical protein
LLADGQTRQSNNHSGIRRDCCVPFRCCRSLVVLIKGHDLCPSEDRGEVCLNFVRSGNKVVWSLTVGLACTLPGGRWTRGYGLTLNESSKGHAFEFIETNSGRGRAPAREPVPSESRCPRGCFWIVVTWLILPVVICLSQRLSHACLSINKFVL